MIYKQYYEELLERLEQTGLTEEQARTLIVEAILEIIDDDNTLFS